MGIGDELMAAGQARAIWLQHGSRVEIIDTAGRRRWHPMWEGLPYIVKPADRGTAHKVICNAPGHRPYIAGKTDERWTWKRFTPTPAEIVFTPAERKAVEWAATLEQRYVVIEPNLKPRASPNKDWGFARYQAVVDGGDAYLPFVQVGAAGARTLRGVKRVQTADFRAACAVLAHARAYIGPEGGLHHAAAALGVPAIVIFGGYISPEQTGYGEHVNLFTGRRPCGMRIACAHCVKAMAEITPDAVLEALATVLRREETHA